MKSKKERNEKEDRKKMILYNNLYNRKKGVTYSIKDIIMYIKIDLIESKKYFTISNYNKFKILKFLIDNKKSH